jgi:hypothetical protein
LEPTVAAEKRSTGSPQFMMDCLAKIHNNDGFETGWPKYHNTIKIFKNTQL